MNNERLFDDLILYNLKWLNTVFHDFFLLNMKNEISTLFPGVRTLKVIQMVS